MINTRNNIAIGILNGGKSTRMGKDKSLVEYNKKPLAEVIYNKALIFSDEIYFLGNSPLPGSIHNPVIVQDKLTPGPLGGIVALTEIISKGCLMWAIDMPLPDIEDVMTMLSLSDNLTKPVIPYNQQLNLYEPLFAYYPYNLLRNIYLLSHNKTYKSIQSILNALSIEGNAELFEKMENKLKSWNYPIDIIL